MVSPKVFAPELPDLPNWAGHRNFAQHIEDGNPKSTLTALLADPAAKARHYATVFASAVWNGALGRQKT